MERQNKLYHWISNLYPNQTFTLKLVAADADFRRYFRVIFSNNTTIICMDAPPEKINMTSFIKIQSLLNNNINVPKIFHINLDNGFMALEDFGDTTFIKAMQENQNIYFHKELLLLAVDNLVKLQQFSCKEHLTHYNQALLLKESNLFLEWFLPKELKKTLSPSQLNTWNQCIQSLLENIAQQSYIFVHRDYIIRNLMLTDHGIGTIDFQDAVYGPISYDILSLTRDAFIQWDEEFTLDIVIRYWEQALKKNLPVPKKFDDFYKQYEFMGVQRHLKVAGIFTRLHYRDQKEKYLPEVKTMLSYLKKTTYRYHELHPLYYLISELIGDDEIKSAYTF